MENSESLLAQARALVNTNPHDPDIFDKIDDLKDQADPAYAESFDQLGEAVAILILGGQEFMAVT